MSCHVNQLDSITRLEKNLLERKKALINKRKHQIANLIEQQALLTVSDEIFLGLFAELKNAMHSQDERLQKWEADGVRFRQNKKLKREKITAGDHSVAAITREG